MEFACQRSLKVCGKRREFGNLKGRKQSQECGIKFGRREKEGKEKEGKETGAIRRSPPSIKQERDQNHALKALKL